MKLAEGGRERRDEKPAGWLWRLALQNVRVLWAQMRVLVGLFVIGYAVSVLVLLLVAGRFSYESLDVAERLGYDPRAAYTVAFQRAEAEAPAFDWQAVLNRFLDHPDLQALQLIPGAGILEPPYQGQVLLSGRTFAGRAPWAARPALGRFFQENELAAGAHVAVVGGLAAHHLGAAPEPGASFFLLGREWEVVGVYGSREPSPVLQAVDVPLITLLDLLEERELGRVSMTVFLWEPMGHPELAAFEADVVMAARDHHWSLTHQGALYEETLEAAVRSNTAALMITAAVAVLAAVNMAALLRYWVKRRRHEVSVRLASGASVADVRSMLLYEQLVLMGVAALVGLGAFAGMVPLLAADGIGIRAEFWNIAAVLVAAMVLVYAISGLIGREVRGASLVTDLRRAAL